MLANKTDYKSLYDQMTDIINTVNEEMNQLKGEQEKINDSFKNMKNSILDINQSVKISKSMFLNNSQMSNKENTHPNDECSKFSKDLEEIRSNITNLYDQLKKLKENGNSKDVNEIKDTIQRIDMDQQKVNQNFQLAINSICSNYMHLKNQLECTVAKASYEELENTFYSIHCEHKIMQKKVQTIEEIAVNQRKEFFSHFTELEKFIISKNETMKQSISQICRNLGINSS